MHAAAGSSILELWNASALRSLFVVGTGKNVGKTVAMRAVYRALVERGLRAGLASIGRDGEAVDIGDASAKPRLWLESGTIIATARTALPPSPASELVDLSETMTAVGPLAFARVRAPAHYELIGPPTASGLRAAVHRLLDLAPYVLVDGAIDRIAALAGGEDAIVIACGASAAGTLDEAVEDVRALAMRLRVPVCEPGEARLAIDGALTPAKVAELLRAGERRAVVVRDPTQIALTGKAAIAALQRLRIRCERPLSVIAATVSSIGRDAAFDPSDFVQAVAHATALPTFDVYAGLRAA